MLEGGGASLTVSQFLPCPSCVSSKHGKCNELDGGHKLAAGPIVQDSVHFAFDIIF